MFVGLDEEPASAKDRSTRKVSLKETCSRLSLDRLFCLSQSQQSCVKVDQIRCGKPVFYQAHLRTNFLANQTGNIFFCVGVIDVV
jgi:hypothetical protein